MHEVNGQDFEYITTQRTENVGKRILGGHLRLIIGQMIGRSLTKVGTSDRSFRYTKQQNCCNVWLIWSVCNVAC